MSYDIRLCESVTKETILLDNPHDMRGGTYAIGGTREAWINVTYNYAGWYYRDGVFGSTGDENKGIRTIYGMIGAESIPILRNAIKVLESIDEDISDNKREKYEKQGASGYWMPTRVNAIKPLYQLMALAQMRSTEFGREIKMKSIYFPSPVADYMIRAIGWSQDGDATGGKNQQMKITGAHSK